MKRSKLSTFLYLFFFILAGVLELHCVFSADFSIGIYSFIASLFSTVTILAGIMYIFYGCGKDAHYFYSAFLLSFATSEWLLLLDAFSHEYVAKVYLVISLTISFAFLVTLGITKNLGKKLSYVFCIFVFLSTVFSLILSLISGTSTIDRILTYDLFRFVAWLIVSGVLLALVESKYEDKEARGTH